MIRLDLNNDSQIWDYQNNRTLINRESIRVKQTITISIITFVYDLINLPMNPTK